MNPRLILASLIAIPALAQEPSKEQADFYLNKVLPIFAEHCYRCHSEIEPWISGLQWFVAVDRLKEPAREVALDGRLTFWPERWTKPYVAWMEYLRDWNIAERWHGLYAKHATQPIVELEPHPGIILCTGTGGAGMTMSFGLAESAWERWTQQR